MNPDRLVVGLATCFDVPSANGNLWSADDFEDFLRLEMGVPLLMDHGSIIVSHGVIPHIGTVRKFAVVTYPVPGLLCLGEIEYAHGVGDSILYDIRSVLSQRWLPPAWGFSVGAKVAEGGEVWLEEVSVTRRPAFGDARILGVGPEAWTMWSLLTEVASDDAAAFGGIVGQDGSPAV